MPKNEPGYMFPGDYDPGEYACFRVYIPKDTLYLAAFWNAYRYFTTWHAWQRDEAKTGKLVAEVWRTGFDLARQEFESGGACDMPNIRINPDSCLLEVECSPDDWRTVITEDYDPTRDAPTPIPYPDPIPGQDRACLAAANTTEFLRQGSSQFATLLGANNVIGFILAQLYTFLSSVVTVTLSQLWLGLGVAYGDFDADTIEADFLAFDWDEVKNILVCYYETDGSMTPINWALALDDFQAQTTLTGNQIWLLITMVWGLFGVVGANYSASWAGIVDADCDACPTCTILTENKEGWDYPVTPWRTYGSWTSGVGFQSIIDGQYPSPVLIMDKSAAGETFNRVEFVIEFSGAWGDREIVVVFLDNPGLSPYPLASLGNNRYGADINVTSVNRIRLVVQDLANLQAGSCVVSQFCKS